MDAARMDEPEISAPNTPATARMRYDNDHAEEAVYDGRNTGQQLGARLEQTVQLFRTVECHEYRRQQTDRHADNDRTSGDVQAAEDHRQDAVNVACPASTLLR